MVRAPQTKKKIEKICSIQISLDESKNKLTITYTCTMTKIR